MPSLKHQPPHRARPRAGSKNHARRLDQVSQASCVVSSRRNCNKRQHQTQIEFENLNRHYDSNQQYSITAVSDGGGSVVERYAYSAYGQITIADASGAQISNSAIANRNTFTGREWDDGLSLYHYRARMYDAVGGRFVSRDPIGFEGSRWNIYAYGDGNPIRFVDPLGLEVGTPPIRQIDACKKNCKRACAGSFILPWIVGGFSTEGIISQLSSIMPEAFNTSISGVTIDLESFATFYMPSDPALHGDWELWLQANINDDGTIKPEGAMHSALRHCYASALLSKSVGCQCAKCLGDWREYPDIWAGLQPLRNTQAQLYNNHIGRVCAGCSGSLSDSQPVGTVVQGPYVSYPIISFPSKSQMLSCCIDAAKNGLLDIAVENTTPLGNNTPIIAIPPQYIRRPPPLVLGSLR